MKRKVVFGMVLILMIFCILALAFYLSSVLFGSPVHNVDTGLDYATIQEAIDAPETLDGHVIKVDAGTYYENVFLRKGITLQGAGAEVTTIDGGGYGYAVSNCRDHFDFIVISNFVVEGFTIKSYNKTTKWGAIRFYSETNTVTGTLRNNIIKDSAYGISVGSNVQLEIFNNIIFGNRNSRNTDGVGISIMWNTRYGVSSTINSNTIVNNYHGIWIYAASAKVINNIVVSNSGGKGYVESTGIDHHGGGSIDILHNDVYENDVNYRANASPGAGDISLNPLFVDATVHDYHLRVSSPCIDAGNNENAPNTDFEGNPKPIDGNGDGIKTVDMGAYELMPS